MTAHGYETAFITGLGTLNCYRHRRPKGAPRPAHKVVINQKTKFTLDLLYTPITATLLNYRKTGFKIHTINIAETRGSPDRQKGTNWIYYGSSIIEWTLNERSSDGLLVTVGFESDSYTFHNVFEEYEK